MVLYVYEMYSKMYPADKYVGVVTNPNFDEFVKLQEAFRDQEPTDNLGLPIVRMIKQSNLSMFIEEHGGWAQWRFRILQSYATRVEANIKKELLLMSGRYTINVYHTDRSRKPRERVEELTRKIFLHD